MKRILTTVIAPCILYFSFLAFDTISGSSFTFFPESPFFIKLLIVYLYSFPFFLFIGIPTSIIIDKINKGVRWVNYAIAGGIVGLIMKIKNIIDGYPILYDLDVFIIFPGASIIFYLLLKSLEIIFTKAFGKHISDIIH
ncbi:hypothetical protein [Saliterribacillus persicus]|uniref:Uncharacterized protein n=1 Tax=Saliterribacillus persicus TaxID=930114 RepID=A0A368X8A9_9BACI|nr:hypothetical protein [Saliterribacillus persicus]RCW63949.1 hypothetical protein DFR57_11574 [Saliterribacillus persicus]